MAQLTITEYAERILFADTLAEKLDILPLDQINETETAAPLSSGVMIEPGRPAELRMRNRGETGKSELPSRPQLVDETSRGRLFHFFGNHELMAAELMALALLKFPDAPREFRLGLLRTLREEQRHTRWYVRRMEECGVAFGALPLNRFFWDAVATMETPLDYVTRLSLTFEQANLDYARHYAAVMREAGDSKSARLMERIYRDEISHVGYGLEWFRKWKQPGQSDWEAYRDSLVFPLSPSRAKGNRSEFNREGRIEAGLDEDFVGELAVFERSKGRTPDVYWFNPDAEAVMSAGLDGSGYEQKRAVGEFVRDVETLALHLAKRDDVLLLREMPRREYLERLRESGFDLPEIEVVASETALAADSLTARRRLRDLRPWAWEPRSDRLLLPLRAALPTVAEVPAWSDPLRLLFSKAAQARRWPQWALQGAPLSFPVGEGDSLAEVGDRIRENWGRGAGPVPIVWKPEFSAAGRGFWLVDPAGLDPRGFDGGPKRVERGAPGVLEPWVERVFDFSVQFEKDAKGLRRLGFTRQQIGESGRYLGTVWSPKFCRGLPPELARYLMHEALPAYGSGTAFPESLDLWLEEAGYRGPVGVDTFLYRDAEGRLAHRVVCEVNPRFTMGRLALDLSRRLSAGHALRLSIERLRPGSESEREVTRDRHGKLSGGTLALTDIDAARGWVAWLTVGPEPTGI